MASSSDEGSTEPKDFQQISSSTGSGSRLSPSRRKCPLCAKFKKTFYCRDCIHNGHFTSSNPNCTDRFIDKQNLLFEIEADRRALERDCLKLLENKIKADILRSKIRHSKDRNRILKLAVEEKREQKQIIQEKLEKLTAKNEQINKMLPRYEEKVHQIETILANRKEKNDKIRNNLKECEKELKRLVRLRLEQLMKYIFPIKQVKPQISEMESSDPSEMVNALAEAAQTTYFKDHWECTDYSGEMKYSIVAPTLPSSGNYSAYSLAQSNGDNVPGSNTTVSAEANSIAAALTYTAQCVNIISYYLNVRLPYKMFYGDFLNTYMTETKFARRVARLNANILYLCYTQNVDLGSLRSSQTIHNLLQLFENEQAELGRQGPTEVDLEQATELEQPLTSDLQLAEDSDSEQGDPLPAEWEAVPHVQCPEVAPGAIAIQSTDRKSVV